MREHFKCHAHSCFENGFGNSCFHLTVVEKMNHVLHWHIGSEVIFSHWTAAKTFNGAIKTSTAFLISYVNFIFPVKRILSCFKTQLT